ncbi:MAG: tryptophan synthase subunit alpha, partial [Bacteroidota bacterium]
GMPFSDPLADGPVIQNSSQIALKNGMSLKVLFEQLKDIRKEVSIPLVLMGYLNPVMQYGIERFCQQCEKIGVDGIILPDLPLQEYEEEYKNMFEKHNLHNVFLITPQTHENRIAMIDEMKSGFIYMVASSSTTGARTGIESLQEDYFNRIKNMQLKTPRVIGFGISNKKTFQTACQYAHGAIIGSAFIKALEGEEPLEQKIDNFIREVKGK